MKKIYFHITFLVLFVLFTLFTYIISIPSCDLRIPGCGGTITTIAIRLLSMFVVILSLLVYLGYTISVNFFGRDSLFLKITIYLLMCSYFLIAIAYWWYSAGVYRFVVPQENLKKQQEWQERKNSSIRLDPNSPVEVKGGADVNLAQ